MTEEVVRHTQGGPVSFFQIPLFSKHSTVTLISSRTNPSSPPQMFIPYSVYFNVLTKDTHIFRTHFFQFSILHDLPPPPILPLCPLLTQCSTLFSSLLLKAQCKWTPLVSPPFLGRPFTSSVLSLLYSTHSFDSAGFFHTTWHQNCQLYEAHSSLKWTPPYNERCYTEQHYMEVTLHIPDCSRSCAVDALTFLEPGGAGSKMRVCISEGRAEYTGRMMRSGTSGPKAFILSYRISQAVSISSWPVKNSSTSPETVKSLCLYSFVQVSHTIHIFLIWQKQQHVP